MPVFDFSPYRKTVTALATGIIGWVSAVLVSVPEVITSAEWVGLATVVAVALGVFAVPNEDR